MRGVRRSGPVRGTSFRGDDAVTPIIGTILVLAISIAGIGLTLFMGLPVLQRIQDQAALESAVGQMKELRAEASRLSVANTSIASGFNLPGGTLSVEPGTRILVTLYRDASFSSCDLRIRGWEDSDAVLNLTSTAAACRTIGFDNPVTCNTLSAINSGNCGALNQLPLIDCAIVTSSCFEAHKFVNGTPDLSTNYVSAPGSCPLYICSATVTLSQNLLPTDDWMFRLTDGAGTVYLESYLLHADRLVWSKSSSAGGVRAVYEDGTLFAQSQGQVYLQSPAPVVENSSRSSTYPAFLRLRTWQSSGFGAASGQGAQVVRVTYGNGTLLSAPSVYQVRLDFRGDLAQAWCNAFLQRNALPTTPVSTAYSVDSGEAARQCNTASPSNDRIRGLLYVAYARNGLGAPTTPFTFTLVQQTLNARLDS